MQKTPHEITLIAYQRLPEGIVVYDICETSHKYASKFARRFYRDPDVFAISAVPPGPMFGQHNELRVIAK